MIILNFSEDCQLINGVAKHNNITLDFDNGKTYILKDVNDVWGIATKKGYKLHHTILTPFPLKSLYSDNKDLNIEIKKLNNTRTDFVITVVDKNYYKGKIVFKCSEVIES